MPDAISSDYTTVRKTTPRIFVPLWHPPEDFESGGLYRARRTLHSMRGFYFDVADSDTSRLDPAILPGRIRTYRAKALHGEGATAFAAMRVANYTWSLLWLIAYGLSAPNIEGVYVPTSELPHVALAGWIVGKVRRVPIAFCNLNVRGVDVWFANRLLHRSVDAVMTISQALAEEIRAEGIRAPILVGTVGVDDFSTGRFAEPAYDGVFVGRHTEDKGVFDVLRAWALVVEQRPGAKLLMMGPVAQSIRTKLQSEIERNALEGLVEIRGAVTDAEKWAGYASARVCVFPSTVEGFGIVPIEAHFAGIAVVAYTLPVYAETIAHSPAADLVPTHNVRALAAAIVRAVDDYPGERAALARAWASQFTWESAAALEARLLQRALGARAMTVDSAAFETASYDDAGDNAQKDARFSARIVESLTKGAPALGSFLDVGCGTGSVLAAARSFATSLAGVDRSEAFLNIARSALPQARFVSGEASALPSFENDSIDTVTFCDVIEHLENPVAALREIHRVLRPGGRVLVTTPNSDSLFRRLLGQRWFGLSDATHLLFFTRFSLATLLERTGFVVEAATTLSAGSKTLANAAVELLGQGGTLLIVARKR